MDTGQAVAHRKRAFDLAWFIAADVAADALEGRRSQVRQVEPSVVWISVVRSRGMAEFTFG